MALNWSSLEKDSGWSEIDRDGERERTVSVPVVNEQ